MVYLLLLMPVFAVLELVAVAMVVIADVYNNYKEESDYDNQVNDHVRK